MTSIPASPARPLDVPGGDGERAEPYVVRPAHRTMFSDLRDIVVDLRHSRDLLTQLTLRDLRVRYKQAVFGFAWALMMPVVVVVAGMIVRVAIAYAANVHLNVHQIASMVVKSVPWAFFVGCMSTATPSLVANMTLVTKVQFPREVLPLAAIIAQTFDSTIGLLIVALALPFLGVTLSLQLLWVPLLLLLLWCYSAAVGLFLSCANLFFRDVKYVVQVFLTFGIFVTPVFLDATMFGPRIAPIIMLNPVAPLLEGLRLSIIEHHNLATTAITSKGIVAWQPWYLAYSGVWALAGLMLAAVFFHRSERRFAEVV